MVSPIFNQTEVKILPKQQEVWDKYCKIIQWGRRHPTRFIEEFVGLQLTDSQKYCFLSSWTVMYSIILMSRNSGKAQDLDSKVYIKPYKDKNGEIITQKRFGDLEVGDKIYGDDGKLTTVLHLNPIIIDEVYEVEFDDGEIVRCNADHLWKVEDRDILKKWIRQGKVIQDPYILRSTDFLYHNFNNKQSEKGNDWRFHAPRFNGIKYADVQYLPVDPYVLGVYLGDGTRGNGTITCSLDDINEMTDIIQKHCHTARWRKTDDNNGLIIVDAERDLKELGNTRQYAKLNSFKEKLKKLGVLENKYIPEAYMISSYEDRLKLLCGLMDTDGTANKDGTCEFCQKDENLCRQVYKLALSLGLKATLTFKEHTGYFNEEGIESSCWRIYITTDKSTPIFKLSRKFNRLREDSLRGLNKKAIVDVRKTGEKKAMRCITVSNDSGCYLTGDKYTITHNSFLSAPYVMARSLLIPNHKSYIMGPTGGQSAETASKLEALATGNIASVIGVSTMFLENAVAANSKVSAFTHAKDGVHVGLFNGSEVQSLTSVPNNLRGIRSNLNVYDFN